MHLRHQRFAAHVGRLRQAHHAQNGGRHIAQRAVGRRVGKLVRARRHHKRDWIGRVRRVGTASIVEHLLGVPVVGRHKENVSVALARFVNGADRGVGGFHARNSLVELARMAHHVRRRKVAHHERVIARVKRPHDLGGNISGAHFWLEVVRRDLGRRNHFAVLERKRRLTAPVEEERHVRVLLRLGDVVLPHAEVRKPFGQDVVEALRREEHRKGELLLVGRHGCNVQALHGRRGFKGRLEKRLANLAHAVGAEVEEDEGVAIPDAPLGIEDDGLEEFVRFARRIACLDRRNGVHRTLAAAADERLPRHLDALPALVTVHGVVAPRHRRHLTVAQPRNERLQSLHVPHGTCGARVTAIAKEVHKGAGHTVFLRCLEKPMYSALI
eukprot:Opistho-1_new@106222